MTEQMAWRTDTRRHIHARQGTKGEWAERGGVDGIHIYRAFLAFVPRPNAVTTLS